MGDSTTFTITAGSAVVAISGHVADASGTKHIVEQTAAGTRLLGSFTPTPFVDQNGANFTKTVTLPAATYTIGGAGRPGSIFITDDGGAIADVTNISVVISGSGGG